MDAKMNIAYARYNRSANKIMEREIISNVPQAMALAYVSNHPSKPLIAYVPPSAGAILFFAKDRFETQAYRDEYLKIEKIGMGEVDRVSPEMDAAIMSHYKDRLLKCSCGEACEPDWETCNYCGRPLQGGE
jgi:hypothetical protein